MLSMEYIQPGTKSCCVQDLVVSPEVLIVIDYA